MDDDGEIERALRRVIGRHGSSLLADNASFGRQLRFELGDSAFDHDSAVVALLKVLRSGALRDIEVGDLGGAYRTATAANPGIAHEAADWSVAVLDRVTAGRTPPNASTSGVRSGARKAATRTTPEPTQAMRTQPIEATKDRTAPMPVTAATRTQPAVPTLAFDTRAAWPTRAKVLVALLALVALAAGATAGFFVLRDDAGSGATDAPIANTPGATTTVAAATTVATTTTIPPTTTIAPTTTVPPTTTTAAPVVVEVTQLKAAGPLGTYALNVVTAACAGLTGCEAFPVSLTAAAQDPARLLTAAGIFAIPVSFAGGIGPWTGAGTGAGAAAGVDCGNIAAAAWTVTVDVTAAQLAQPPLATSMNYAFRASADPACPTQGTAEFTGTLRRTG